MRNVLGQEIGSIEPKELPPKIWEAVGQTFSKMEFKAIYGLFAMGIPPLGYSDEEQRRSYAKYSFLVFKRNGNLTSMFHMSSGPDIVFLPLTVGVFYEFVVDKLQDKNKKEILDKATMALLKEHHLEDCRSKYALWKLPLKILISNDINNI